MKQSDIKFTVSLDDEKFPEKIQWTAEDSGIEGVKECSAVMISIWDGKDNSTLRIDLWTKEMMVEEMHHLFYETFRSMADTYLRATNNEAASEMIRQFADKFGKLDKS